MVPNARALHALMLSVAKHPSKPTEACYSARLPGFLLRGLCPLVPRLVQ